MEQGVNLLADFPLPPPFFFSHFGNMRTSSETMDFRAKACSKNNSSLERVDSRVQHIWRLRVIGSWVLPDTENFENLDPKLPSGCRIATS